MGSGGGRGNGNSAVSVDVAAEFGNDPDADEVDAHVRSVMQGALNQLARKRRLPVLG
ncbi:MAG: hypothetical protein ACXVGB_12440 [Mycobacteriaceae bacterium]|jgi:hypothetical protein